MATKPENPQRVLLVFGRNSRVFGLAPLKARVPWRFIHSLRDARFCVSTCRRNEKNATINFGSTSIRWAFYCSNIFRSTLVFPSGLRMRTK
jgi:hypothetical protein